jgi:hypothetical protein
MMLRDMSIDAPVSKPPTCNVKVNTDLYCDEKINGTMVKRCNDIVQVPCANITACCALCIANSTPSYQPLVIGKAPPKFKNSCNAWSYTFGRKLCYLKNGAGKITKSSDTSGHLAFPTEHEHTAALGSLDWVLKGAVTPVKDQGSTGDCWSFSDTGSLEGRYFVASGRLISLSEENLVDCSTHHGSLHLGLDWVHNNSGLCAEAGYPWRAGKSKCTTMCTKKVTCTKAVHLPNSVTDIAAELRNGPLSVAIDAQDLQQYKSGVIDDPNCGTKLNHAVLLVGYGSDNSTGKPYWKVKNSWNASWGEGGYFRIVIGKNMCGMEGAAWYVNATRA